jgi:hypothetical protein
MDGNIVLPTNYLLIILATFLGLTVWYAHIQKKYNYSPNDLNYNDTILDIVNKRLDELKNNQEYLEKRRYLDRRDVKALYDDLSPPERRQPEHAYLYKNRMINIPSRGFPDSYQLVGVLLRNNTETVYNLFGRQTYPGSNQYEYYVKASMNDNDVKLPLSIKGDKEIEDGQAVEVPGTDPSKGEFITKLYKFDSPRYNPLVIL